MERASPHPGRTDAQLYGSGEDHWTAQSSARGGECLRFKPGGTGGAMPSRGAEEWQHGWIPLGREEESGPAGKRALSKWQLGKLLPQRTRSTAKEEGILNFFSGFAPFAFVAVKALLLNWTYSELLVQEDLVPANCHFANCRPLILQTATCSTKKKNPQICTLTNARL
jgi:hypothetical protein